MVKRKMKKNMMKSKNMACTNNGCGGFFYFLGFLGSAIYYIQQSTGFWAGVLGFIKALVWPLFLVYKLLGI